MTMRTWIFWSLLTVSGSTFATCEPPKEPETIDGKNATKAEMLKTKENVSIFLKNSKIYLACLKAAEALEEIEKPKVQGGYTENSEKYIIAVTHMTRARDNFKHQLERFNNR